MSHRVVTYNLPALGRFSLEMPRGAQVLSVFSRGQSLPGVVVLVPREETEVETRPFLVVPSHKDSDLLQHARYIGSVDMFSEMVHVFERSARSLDEKVEELRQGQERLMAAFTRGGRDA